MKYKEVLTQENRIIELLKERGTQGVYVYELQAPRPIGLGIAQYNARIYGLRKKGHVIKSTTPGHFVLLDSSQSQIQASQVTTRRRKRRSEYADWSIDQMWFDETEQKWRYK